LYYNIFEQGFNQAVSLSNYIPEKNMNDIVLQVRPATDQLMREDEDKLYLELGRRLRAMQQVPSLGGSFSPSIDTGLEPLGPAEDLEKFAHRFFDRINIQAYNLVCGKEAEDTEERQRVIDAFDIGKDAVAAAVAGLLIIQIGMAPAIAPVVAAIIIRLFFKPALGAMCDVWKEKLPEK
jgi:hypothetical protein